jgi:hypothetical protein
MKSTGLSPEFIQYNVGVKGFLLSGLQKLEIALDGIR